MKIYRLPEKTKTIIFDIDSTLYTNGDYAFEQVDVQVRHFARLRGMSDEEARSLIGGWRKKWSDSHGGKKISLGNTLVEFGIPIEESARWRETLLDPARFLSRDARLSRALLSLKKKFALICVTNNPVLPARKTLDALGVLEIIGDVIGLDTCLKSKPAREPFLLAARRTGARPDECLSVGDRYDMDIALPLEMGMGGILVDGVADVYSLPDSLGARADP